MSTKEKIMEVLKEAESGDLVSLTREMVNTMVKDKFELARAIIYGNVTNVNEPVRFNGYGNLESVSEYELIKECENNIDEIADWIMDNGTSNIYTLTDELEEILNEQEEDMEVE